LPPLNSQQARLDEREYDRATEEKVVDWYVSDSQSLHGHILTDAEEANQVG